MNKVILMGRLTRDPEVRYSQGDSASAVARYTLAVDRRFRRDGEASADFIKIPFSAPLPRHSWSDPYLECAAAALLLHVRALLALCGLS